MVRKWPACVPSVQGWRPRTRWSIPPFIPARHRCSIKCHEGNSGAPVWTKGSSHNISCPGWHNLVNCGEYVAAHGLTRRKTQVVQGYVCGLQGYHRAVGEILGACHSAHVDAQRSTAGSCDYVTSAQAAFKAGDKRGSGWNATNVSCSSDTCCQRMRAWMDAPSSCGDFRRCLPRDEPAGGTNTATCTSTRFGASWSLEGSLQLRYFPRSCGQVARVYGTMLLSRIL